MNARIRAIAVVAAVASVVRFAATQESLAADGSSPGTAGAAAATAGTAGHHAAGTAGELQFVPGTAADVLAAVRSPGAEAVVVNLWATWCVPCREEFPDLMRFARDYKDRGVRLVLVSGDFDSETAAAKEFLASQGVNFRTFRKSQKDEEFINAFDPAWTGALPATFVYDASGARRHSFLGPVTYEALVHEVAPLIGASH